MKLSTIAICLTAVVDAGQAFRLADLTNHTVVGLAKVSKRGLTPPIPLRPAPVPPSGSDLVLGINANDEDWDKAKCKGANFVRAMRGSDRDAGQIFKPPRDSAASQFENLDFNFAEKWGWAYSETITAGDFKDWGVDHVLRDLELSDKCHGWGGFMDCLTFVHGFMQLEDGSWDQDPTPYHVEGRTYRPTGAHYSIAFDAKKGVIIAMDRESPQSAGKEMEPPVEGDELPAIRASSDILWLYWKMYGDIAKGPNYFMSLGITNEATYSILSRAIREAIPDARYIPAWGGYNFDTNTPEGQALLGTPNAQAFSYFLLEHKATLGNLYISEVRVFRDNRKASGPNLLLVVKPVTAPVSDAPEPSDSKKPFEAVRKMFAKMKIKKGGSAANKVKVAAKSPAELPAPKALLVMPRPVPDLFSNSPQPTYLELYPSAADGEWDSAKCKGANFVIAMKGSDWDAGKIFSPPRESAAGLYSGNNLDDLTNWGWSGQEAEEPSMKHYGIDGVLRDMGSSDTLFLNGGDIRLVSFRHGVPEKGDNGDWVPVDQQRYKVNDKEYRYTGAWYNFAVDEVNGVIIATDRMSPQEIGSKVLPAITEDDLPLIRAFSDFAWITWETLAQQAETDVKNIHYFMTLSITNELTQRILSRCIREVLPGSWGFPEWPGFEFDTSTPQGQAILGTPNAQAFSYFLLQHKKELGDLYISKIRVFHDANWIAHANLLLIIESVPVTEGPEKPEEPETSAAAQAQVQKRATSTIPHLRQWWNRAKL